MGQACTDMKHPILDFDPDQGECVCRSHPCWNHEGVTHTCETDAQPYIHFQYNEHGKMSCSCTDYPSYTTVHIARDKCPGEACADNKNHVLDYDESQDTCIC